MLTLFKKNMFVELLILFSFVLLPQVNIFAQDPLTFEELKGMQPKQLSAMLSLSVAGNLNPKEVKMLVAAGADINYADDFTGNSILHSAVIAFSARKAKLIAFLIKKGAKSDTQNKKGETPLHILCKFGRTLLKEIGKEEFHITFKGLIKHMKNVDAVDNKGLTALHLVCDSALLELATILINAGAKLDVTDKKGETAIFHAISSFRKGGIDIVKLLIEKGANLSITNSDGLTPGAFARKNNSSMAKLFKVEGTLASNSGTEECRKNRGSLMAAIEIMNMENIEMITGVSEAEWPDFASKLLKDKYISKTINCPDNGKYSWQADRIKCSKHLED